MSDIIINIENATFRDMPSDGVHFITSALATPREEEPFRLSLRVGDNLTVTRMGLGLTVTLSRDGHTYRDSVPLPLRSTPADSAAAIEAVLRKMLS